MRVLAAGVNPVDCKTRRGAGVSRWVGPPPFVPGWDVAGVVEGKGYGVTRFELGDLVYGMPKFPRAAGAYAEYVTAPSRQLARAPKKASAVEAAALPLAALTAWQCLIDVAGVKQGDCVLIHGATGGVGHLAAQMARARGAEVVAAGGPGVQGVDVALDLVGGEGTAALLGALKPGGLLLAVADGASDQVKEEGRRRGVRVVEPLVEPDGHALDEIAGLVDSGAVEVKITEVFPLERAADAHRRLERGGVRGKLVLEVSRS